MLETIYVGLDLGSSFCCQSVIDAGGTLRSSRFVRTSERDLRNAFAGLGGDVRVHMEAGELADWAGSIIAPMVKSVTVSHPRSLAWIGKDSVKDDKVDAGKLAELLRLNRVHEVYRERDSERRTFRHLVTHHEQASREQARRKSKIKARLRTLGVIRKDAGLFTANGQAALLEAITQPEISG
ncbi:MAG: IS110 family transposase [Blastocatellia bacterium]